MFLTRLSGTNLPIAMTMLEKWKRLDPTEHLLKTYQFVLHVTLVVFND